MARGSQYWAGGPVASKRLPTLVTGATGFIGGNLARELCRREYQVRALVRPGSNTLAIKDTPVETVPGDILDREKSIYRAQVEGLGKPAQVIDKIVEGKLGSFYSQVVLPDQASIRDPKMTVADVLAAAAGTLGTPVTVARFARLKVGEAI